jgi:pimeloyl-ACP methyl ester carboxylesterase
MDALLATIEKAEHLTLPSWLRQQFLETDAEMFALELEAWREWHGPWPLLPQITAPSLLLVGEGEDDGTAAQAAAMMSDARAFVIPGHGHVGAFLRSDLVLPHATTFLHKLIATR